MADEETAALVAEFNQLGTEVEELSTTIAVKAAARREVFRKLNQGRTQREVAELLGLSQGRISQLARKMRPSENGA